MGGSRVLVVRREWVRGGGEEVAGTLHLETSSRVEHARLWKLDREPPAEGEEQKGAPRGVRGTCALLAPDRTVLRRIMYW